MYFIFYNSNPNNFACFNRAFQLIRIRDNPNTPFETLQSASDLFHFP
ncbi:hypothetical protein ACTHTM_03660 [Neisseria sp. P0018.S003]